MTREEALRYIVYDLSNDYRPMEEKYNSGLFLFGIDDDRVPNPDGLEWVCEIESTYASVTNWEFRLTEDWLKERWARHLDWGDDFYGDDEEAWRVLGFDPSEVSV